MGRAQVVEAAPSSAAVEDIAVRLGLVRLGLARNAVYLWLHRVEARELAGLEDQPRGGRPPTDRCERVGEFVAAARPDPRTLELPFRS